MSDVEWRAIPGYEGLYEVSNHGQVRSLDRVTAQGVSIKGRIRCCGPNAYGYPTLALNKDGARKIQLVHRLVLLAFVGPCPEGHEGLHADGTRNNNRLDNLSYGTRSDNVRDSLKHGTNVNAAKTHCKRGHAFTEANIYRNSKRGVRECRACWSVRRAEKKLRAA